MTSVLDITEVRDARQLTELVPEWWELWRQVPTATPFQSPPWLLAWWETFGPGRMLTVAVWDDQNLVALAPFYLETGTLGLRLLPIGISLSDYSDILADPDATAAFDAIADWLARCRSWETCEIGGLLPNAAALALPCPLNCGDSTADDESCPVLDLFTGPKDAGAHPAIPALQRRKLRMARHRLERGPSSTVLSTQDLSADEWLDVLITLHGARWRERAMPGVLADPQVQAFHRRVLPEFISIGIARLFALKIGNDIAGVYYGFSHRNRAYAYLGGFDPRFSYYSPGTVLLGHAIEDALRNGAREFHFLRGREPYKRAWGAHDQKTFRRKFVKQSPHG